MSIGNRGQRWGRISQTLHWLIAALILLLGVVGLLMGELPKTPKYFWVYTAHKSLGISVLVLVLIRLGWRLYAGRPAALTSSPRWQQRLANTTHHLLYLLMLMIPLAGWLFDSASGLRPFRWFGLVLMPKLSSPDPQLRALAHGLHEWGFWLLISLVLVHAGAACHHHLVQRDGTLARMLPRGWLSPHN